MSWYIGGNPRGVGTSTPACCGGRGAPFPRDAHIGTRYMSDDQLGDQYDTMGCGSKGVFPAAQTVWNRQTPLLRRMITTAAAG